MFGSVNNVAADVRRLKSFWKRWFGQSLLTSAAALNKCGSARWDAGTVPYAALGDRDGAAHHPYHSEKYL